MNNYTKRFDDAERLQNAIDTIKDYCNNTDCEKCLLGYHGECSLMNNPPYTWSDVEE